MNTISFEDKLANAYTYEVFAGDGRTRVETRLDFEAIRQAFVEEGWIAPARSDDA